MGIRSFIANSIISTGISLGKMMGLEMAVVVSDHSITTQMEVPSKSKRAWDRDMFKSGNLFISGYANPIKPRVNQHPDLEDPNTAEVQEGEVGEENDAEEEQSHAQLITSGRYREFMRQNLISQLLTPESRWNVLVYAVIAIAGLQFMNMIMTLWATGSF